jgi:hypothetical protein
VIGPGSLIHYSHKDGNNKITISILSNSCITLNVYAWIIGAESCGLKLEIKTVHLQSKLQGIETQMGRFEAKMGWFE